MFVLLTQHYGIDIAAMLLTFWGIYWIGDKRRNGFVLTFLGNCLWMIFAIMTQGIALLFTNIVIAVLNVRGYLKWQAKIV